MSREHNGIHNPNKPPKPNNSSDTDKSLNDGQKAFVYASLGIALFTINFGLPRALNKAADGIDAKGEFAGGMYFPTSDPESDAVFKCNSEGNVIRSETVTRASEFTGEEEITFEPANYGPQDGACDDGQLTPRDGDFWNSKVSEWGLAGLIFK